MQAYFDYSETKFPQSRDMFGYVAEKKKYNLLEIYFKKNEWFII